MSRMSSSSLTLFVTLLLLTTVHASTCIGINGQPVDWFVLYKLPGNCATSPWQRGNVSLYLDPTTSNTSNPWVPSSIDAQYPLGLLLAQLTTDNTSLVMYNDQPPWFDGMVKPSYTLFLAYAHAKGLLHWNDTHGFMLQHSVPNWPNITSAPDWTYIPTPQTCNGQHLLCMSMDTSAINAAAAQILNTTRPTVYQVQSSGVACTHPCTIHTTACANSRACTTLESCPTSCSGWRRGATPALRPILPH